MAGSLGSGHVSYHSDRPIVHFASTSGEVELALLAQKSRRQIDNPDGTHDHEVAMSSLVGGLSAALRNAIGEMEMDPETVKWLREMRDWIFLEVAP